MSRVTWKLFDDLNRLKGYEGVYSSTSSNAILIRINDKVFKITLEEIKEKEVTNEVINKYL